MESQEIVFKTRVDTGNTVNDINKIETELKQVGQQVSNIDNVEKSFNTLNQKIEDGGMTVRELTRAVKEYANIAIQAGEDSPIGQEAIKRAGELRDRLGDLQTQINNNANDGRNMQTALAVGSVVTAGYGAIQGAMALVGGESENLTKTLVKLQAVQSVLAGIEEIRKNLEAESLIVTKAKLVWDKVKIASEYAYGVAVGTSTGAVKLMRIAMLSLPIVAIIAGIVAITSAMNLFGDSAEESAEKQRKFNEAQKKSAEDIDRIISQSEKVRNKKKGGLEDMQRELELMKASGATREEVHKKEMQIVDEQINNLIIRGQSLDQSNKYERQLAWKTFEELRTIKNQKLVLEAQYEKESRDLAQQSAEEKAKKKKERDAKALAEQEENAKKQLELERLMTDLIVANIEDAELRRLEQLRISHQREREDLIAKYGTNTELLKQLEIKQNNELEALKTTIKEEQLAVEKEKNDKLLAQQNANEKASLEAKLLGIQNDFEQEIELKKQLALVERNQELQNLELTNGEKEKIQAEYEAKIRALNQETADRDIENQQRVRDESFKIANESLSSIQNLSDVVFLLKAKNLEKGSKAELEHAKKQFEINKALQIGGAVINGAQAVMTSLASAPLVIGTVPNPAGIASLAFAVSSSIATIAKISATKFGNGGAVTPPSAPPVNSSNTNAQTQTASGATGGNETNTLNATNTATGIKVSVVDSEIKAIMDASAQVNVISTMGG